jgi:hypothetical protein
MAKPAILPLRPGEVAMTAAPGSSVAQRRLMTTVQPGRGSFRAQDGAVLPMGVRTGAGTRTVPPLQPNATRPSIVSQGARSNGTQARVRNSNANNRAASTASVGTVQGNKGMLSSLHNPILGKNSPIGGYKQDAHAIPTVLQGNPVRG